MLPAQFACTGRVAFQDLFSDSDKFRGVLSAQPQKTVLGSQNVNPYAGEQVRQLVIVRCGGERAVELTARGDKVARRHGILEAFQLGRCEGEPVAACPFGNFTCSAFGRQAEQQFGNFECVDTLLRRERHKGGAAIG